MRFMTQNWNNTPTKGISGMDVYSPAHTERIYIPSDFQTLVKDMAKFLKKLNARTSFDAVAACGNSGIPLASALSFLLGIPFLTVRKTQNAVADSRYVNGLLTRTRRYVIVDDLIESGGTIRKIMSQIETAARDLNMETLPEPVAVVLYDSRGAHPDDNQWVKFFSYQQDPIPVLHLYSGTTEVPRSKDKVRNYY